MSEPELQFKPLSDGLGFHPFSNGLPYTPAAPKRELSRGTGAIAAGQQPKFLFPQTPARSMAAAAPALLPKPRGWDYVGRRFFAFLIDSAIHVSLGIGVLAASLWSSLDIFASADVILASFAFLLFLNWALIAAQEVAFGTSIGKRLFGLSVEGSAVALLVRALLFIPSAFVGLGVIWCAFDSRNRGFHDLLTGIQPEEG